MMIGPAFVDGLFDAIPVALLLADDLRLERRLLGEAAERVDHAGAEELLALAHIVRRLELGDLGAAGVQVLLRLGAPGRRPPLARCFFGIVFGKAARRAGPQEST